MAHFTLCPPDEMPQLLAFGLSLFEARTTLEQRRHGRTFAQIARDRGITELQVEETQIAALRCLIANGAEREDLASLYRFTKAQLAHALGPEPPEG
jgi:hypothetical protein